jgi:plastocyanin
MAAALLLVLGPAALATSRATPAGPTGGPSEWQAAAATGSIEGVVRARPVPQRRAAARYPDGPGSAAPVQAIPMVVYVQGPVGGARPPAPSRAVMGQRDERFEPAMLVVMVGATVEFPNGDPFFHNVFSYSRPARFDLGRYPRGESKEVRFDAPGVVRVYCEVHESMRAAIVVVENPYWAKPDDDGRFRIDGVPPGTYTLVAWHPDRREREVRVVVTAGESTRAEIDL